MAGDANQVYPAGADLDHEQDVQRLEQHRNRIMRLPSAPA